MAQRTARAQGETEYFEERQKPHLEFQWDFLARYDRIEKLVFRPDIHRGRFELRTELDWVFSDRLRVGARAIGDLGTDRNSDNARNFDNYRTTGSTLERWFVEARPGPLDIRLGSFGMPLVATEMLWDRDIQSLGAAAAWQLPVGGLILAAGAFRGPQRDRDRTRVEAGQLVWRRGDPASFAIEAAGSFWSFEPDRLRPAYIRQNYSRSVIGGPVFVSRFRIADAIVRLRFPLGAIPLMVSLDGLENFGSRGEARGDDKAFEGSITAGDVGTPGRLRGFYTYQYVQRDAVMGAYNTDDWWFHSWYRGHRVALAITVAPRIFVQGAAVFQQRLDRSTWLNRFTVDLVKMF
ncbi:MAG: putative porin [Acidobacteria bacterium]|nr:putative porin [Acidobacteriota bacterium]MCA1612351.1 putative porin [Acidobacteriota bacterium]